MSKAIGICKSSGHCYRAESYEECEFWIYNPEHLGQVGSVNGPVTTIGVIPARSFCSLFGSARKDASKSLVCCNKIYGTDYEGRP